MKTIISVSHSYYFKPPARRNVKNFALTLVFYLQTTTREKQGSPQSGMCYIFRFQNNEFQLIGAETFSFHRASHESTKYSFNFITRNYSITTESGNENEKPVVLWKKLPAKALQTFDRFKVPFMWEVLKDVML